MTPDATKLSPSPQPSPGVPGEGASDRPSGSLTLLREWQSVCDAVAEGRNHVLIRKGGIAEGREGFQIRKNFFGLLPTLFHQVKNADPSAQTPEPPHTVQLICQLVDVFGVPSTTDLSTLASFHAYDADQLVARQHYKTERPLNLILVRPFRLRQTIEIEPGQIQAVCRSWIELPLNAGLGGIEAITDPAALDPVLESARQAMEALPNAQRLNV